VLDGDRRNDVTIGQRPAGDSAFDSVVEIASLLAPGREPEFSP
jgi:hypothetical protein